MDFARESDSDGSHDEVRRMTKPDGSYIHFSLVKGKIKIGIKRMTKLKKERPPNIELFYNVLSLDLLVITRSCFCFTGLR